MADDSNLGMGNGNPYLGKDNPYLQNIIDMSSRDMVDNYGRSAQPAFNAAMVRSGSFGNSGVDEMNRAGQQQLQTSLGDLSSKLRFNDYTQQQQMHQWQEGMNQNQSQFNDRFGRDVFNDAYSQNMNNLQTGMGLMGALGQYNSADAATAQNNYNAPLDYLRQFTNMAQGVGGLGGQQSGQQGTSSSPVASALGGAQLGKSFSDWWGSSGSGSSGSSDSGSSGGGWWA